MNFSSARRGGCSSRTPASRPGASRLPQCLGPGCCAPPPAPAACPSDAAGLAAFRAKGQAPHLPLHERRPSQLDLWDYKPKLSGLFDTDLPDSIRSGQRLTTMTSGQKRFPDRPLDLQVRPARPVRHAGSANCFRIPRRSWMNSPSIKSVHTEAINHDPGSHFLQTGNQVPGRPSIGAWTQLRPWQRERKPAGVRGHDLRWSG